MGCCSITVRGFFMLYPSTRSDGMDSDEAFFRFSWNSPIKKPPAQTRRRLKLYDWISP